MDAETMKNAILRVLKRKGATSISTLKNFAARAASKEDFQAVLNELAHRGEINTKPGSRGNSLVVWLPGIPEPPGGKKAASEPATAKHQRNIKQRQTDISSRAAPSRRNGSPPKNGGGAHGLRRGFHDDARRHHRCDRGAQAAA